jgi:hypothetical protein
LDVLRFRSLPAGSGDEHLQVEQFRQVLTVVVGHHSFDDQHFPVGIHRGAHIAQDLQRLLVVPVVNDVLEHVRDAAGGHRLEK